MIEMAHTVKTADLPIRLAAKLFAALNMENVIYVRRDPFCEGSGQCALISSLDPEELIYPEGWYFAKGHFRNKHNTGNYFYDQMPIYCSGGNGECW